MAPAIYDLLDPEKWWGDDAVHVPNARRTAAMARAEADVRAVLRHVIASEGKRRLLGAFRKFWRAGLVRVLSEVAVARSWGASGGASAGSGGRL